MHRSDFTGWKNDPITQVFMALLRQRYGDVASSIVSTAGLDEKADRFKAGYVQAIVDMLNVDFEEMSPDDEVEGSGSEGSS